MKIDKHQEKLCAVHFRHYCDNEIFMFYSLCLCDRIKLRKLLTQIDTKKIKYFFKPSLNFCRESYITSASWVVGNEQISVVWMTRSQNMSIISTCFAPEWKCIEVI